MEPRIDYTKVAPGLPRALMQLEAYVNNHTGLDPALLDLVRLRASQINGCAYCVDMHSKDLRARGDTEQRLYALVAWREAPFFSERERAALEWTEAVTLVAQGHVPDDVYQRARRQFTELELVNLTAAIIAINAWNRAGVAFRLVPGDYQPQAIGKTA
jgi:AhpD family alkylhydroperoxidase